MGESDVFSRPGLVEHIPIPMAPFPSGPGAAGDTFKTGGKRRRRGTTKTFPKGILRRTSRILPTSNPTTPLLATKGGKTRRHRLRLTTPKGAEKTRKQVHARAEKTDIKTIREKLEQRGIVGTKKKIPEKMLRILYANSVGAGLLS
jgi:hypothetical protein